MSKAINTIRNAISSFAYPMPTVETVVGELEDITKKLERELAELATEKHRLLIALHEAINRPKGIVPHEAEEFYEQDFYSNNSAQ